MVGIFSKFSAIRSGHRRAQSAIEERVVMPPNLDANDANNVAASVTSHGIQVAIEFKPMEHPFEPLDSDEPVHCPLPEPSILNDGRVWKERVSAASMRRRTDSSLTTADSDGILRTKTDRLPSNNTISHSQSAPEHNFLDLLEEYFRDEYGFSFLVYVHNKQRRLNRQFFLIQRFLERWIDKALTPPNTPRASVVHPWLPWQRLVEPGAIDRSGQHVNRVGSKGEC
ncbi:hypothetical protein V2J09_020317 [Rumex salicifolius]